MPESTSDIATQAATVAGGMPHRRLGFWLAIGSAIALLAFFCWIVIAAFSG